MSKFLLISSLLFLGCKEKPSEPVSGNERPYEVTPDSIIISNETILEIMYSNEKYPEDFYREDLNGGSIYYVSSLSILPLNKRKSEAYQLSTNSRDTAYNWSESSNVNSSYYRHHKSERETEKYFEFRTVNQVFPNDIVLFRVHKLSYLDRSMYNTFTRDSLIAKFNHALLDIASVKELSEYFWFIEYYNWSGSKPIVSLMQESGNDIRCILYHLLRTGNDGAADNVHLRRSVYRIDKFSRDVIVHHSIQRSIVGRSTRTFVYRPLLSLKPMEP